MSKLNTTIGFLLSAGEASVPARAPVALAVLLGLSAAHALARPVVYEVSGQLTQAENLTFAVLNGSLLGANPRPGDLPLGFTGTLTIDAGAGTAGFAFGGSFASPQRAYTFDLVTPNIIDGLAGSPAGDAVAVTDAFDAFDFELAFSTVTGQGEFSLLLPGGVPTSVPLDISARGSITQATLVTAPVADWNADGRINIGDVLDFLADWGAAEPGTDLNADTAVDVLDVIAFLSAWNG